MIIDTFNKTITITSIYEYISISDENILRYHKKINNKYNVFNLDDIKIFYNYQLIITLPHVLEYENIINVENNSKIYNISDLHKIKLKNIKCSCTYPNDELINFIESLNIYDICLAEIGIRYSITSKKLINKLNDRIQKYDLFEKITKYANYAKEIFNDNDKINVYEGDASISLSELDTNIIYNFVYFDASHLYDIDKQILNELEKHINQDTIIWFDDYDIDDVYKLANEFKEKNICTAYGYDHNEKSLIKLTK